MSVVQDVSTFAGSVRDCFTDAGDSQSLVQDRVDAAVRSEALPVPKYERSDLARRNLAAYSVAGPERAGDWRALAEPFIGADDGHPLLVIADGHVVLTRGLEGLSGQGVVFTSLRGAVREHADLTRSLGTVVPSDDRLLALNAALWRDGAFVFVPKGVRMERPLQLVHVTTTAGHGTFPRNLIVAEADSQVTFLDAYASAGDLPDELCVAVTEVTVGRGARVKAGTVQDFSRSVTSVAVRRAAVDAAGEMDWVTGETGDGFGIVEFGSELDGEGGRSSAHAIAIGTGRAHLDLTARMVHAGRHTTSDISARGVMQDRANAVYRGLTVIKKDAHDANGSQTEKLLMLSPKSRAVAIPMLLIDENDVKCGHAASVGQINPDQLFYLMSRGVSERAAKRMIVWGFIDPVLAELPIDAVRTAMEKVVERKLA